MKYLRKTALLGLVALSAFVFSGCVSNLFPGGPSPAGAIVTSVKTPAQNLTVAIDATAANKKTGTATATAWLGLFAFGDAGVDAAMKNGGITKVHHIDHQVDSALLGIWLQTTTVVYGE